MNFCNTCRGEGFFFAQRIFIKSLLPYVFKCTCPAGQRLEQAYPVWNDARHASIYEWINFPKPLNAPDAPSTIKTIPLEPGERRRDFTEPRSSSFEED